MTGDTTTVTLNDGPTFEVRTTFPPEVWPTAVRARERIESDELAEVADEDLVDVILALVVDDDLDPEEHSHRYTDRYVWESFAERHGTGPLAEAFTVITAPAFDRYRDGQ